MGDENNCPAGGFMFRADESGEWESLGYVGADGISFGADCDDGELEEWTGKLVELANQQFTFRLKFQWWSLNRFYKLVTGRYKYTVRSLRRDRKGHPRCRW